MSDQLPEFVSVQELSARWRVGADTVRRRLRAKFVKGLKPLRVHRDAVLAMERGDEPEPPKRGRPRRPLSPDARSALAEIGVT